MHHGHEESYRPYTIAHVITMLQLLMFAVLAFVVLMTTKLYPAEIRSTNLDTDWFYRKPLPWLLGGLGAGIAALDRAIRTMFIDGGKSLIGQLSKGFGETGLMSRTWATNTMAFWAAMLLGIFLLIYYS